MEAILRPASVCEDVVWTQSVRHVWHPIPNVDGHGPQGGIGNRGPMKGRMEHHGASDGHDCLDGSLSNATVVMGADSSVTNPLVSLGEMLRKASRRKVSSIVGLILLWNDSKVVTKQLKGFLGGNRLVRADKMLELDVDEARSVVDKEVITKIQVGILATRREEVALGLANEVIHAHSLPWKELVSTHDTISLPVRIPQGQEGKLTGVRRRWALWATELKDCSVTQDANER